MTFARRFLFAVTLLCAFGFFTAPANAETTEEYCARTADQPPTQLFGTPLSPVQQKFLWQSNVNRCQFDHSLWVFVQWTFWLGITLLLAVLIARNWEAVAVWVYSLKPHPAADIVHHAIATGRPIDESLFVEAMQPIPASRYEKLARQAQAEDLALSAHQHAASMLAEAERVKAKAISEAAFIEAQDALAKATIIHEQAQARLAALKKQVQGYGSTR